MYEYIPLLPCACYISCPSHPPWRGEGYKLSRKHCIISLSSAFCHIISLGPNVLLTDLFSTSSHNALPVLSESQFQAHTKLQENSSFVFYDFMCLDSRWKDKMFTRIHCALHCLLNQVFNYYCNSKILEQSHISECSVSCLHAMTLSRIMVPRQHIIRFLCVYHRQTSY